MSNMKHLILGENLQYLFREKNNNGAEFTAKSIVTNKEYTFKISRSFFKERWFTHIHVETGYQNYIRLGCYFMGKITDKKEKIDTPSAKAIAWILRKVENKEWSELDKGVEIMHTGSCLVCGLKLTDSKSIEHGIGPICRSHK